MPPLLKISCMITDVIRYTLSNCSYTECNDVCWDYLIAVGDDCPVVFHNQKYLQLWETLFSLCAPEHLFVGEGH